MDPISSPRRPRQQGLQASPATASIASASRSASLVLLKGIGVEGDAHAGPFVRHRYLARRKPAMTNARQIHLIPVELLEALRAENCVLGPGDLGENVLTTGLDLESLPLGTILKLGAEAAIELTGQDTVRADRPIQNRPQA